MTKYCDLDPKFPKKAWAGLMLMKKNENSILIPIKRFFPSKEEEKMYLESICYRMKTKPDNWAPVLVKIKLAELLKNKRELWTKVKKQIKIDNTEMMIDYLDVFKYPKLYQLLTIGNRPCQVLNLLNWFCSCFKNRLVNRFSD